MLLGLMDWNSLLSGLIGAVIGGLITVAASIWGVYKGARKSFDYSRHLQKEAEIETTRRVLLAIKAEVETIWAGYQLEVGQRVEALKPGEGLNLIYKLRQPYFTVYDSNAQYLGHVEDDQLRAAIVRTYTLGKGLVDTHLVNNDLLAQHMAVASVDLSSNMKLANPFLVENQKRVARRWQEFGAEIKAAYDQTRHSVENLLKLLNESEMLRRCE